MATAELLSQRRAPDWLLSGMLRQHQAAVILGPSGCLKTALAIDLGGALATGGKFLGEFAAERAFRVGFVGALGARDSVIEQAQRWSDASGANLVALDNLVWGLNLADAAALGDSIQGTRLRDWILQYELEVVLIDAADLLAPTRRSEAEQLRALVQLCLEAGATPIVCCRTRKQLPPRPLTRGDLAEAPCHGAAQQWLLVNRREAFVPGTGHHALWLTLGSGGGASGQWGVDILETGGETDLPDARMANRWEVLVRDIGSIEEEAAQVAAEAVASRLQEKLKATLRQLPHGSATKLKIRELSGMSGGKFAATWDWLFQRGEIAQLQAGGSGESARDARYCLAENVVAPEEAEKNEESPVHLISEQEIVGHEIAELIRQQEKMSPSSPLRQEKGGRSSPPGPLNECVIAPNGKIYRTAEEALADRPPPDPPRVGKPPKKRPPQQMKKLKRKNQRR
ncbi:AAA family ATPase [Blastopirellula retiformator]|uniref:AAA family ATPase n=1 Tax=Blastopirellula retiformator TaxID=2527970 RepID=UPI001647EED3|nr:AAA family ATPase [Blastopirellula retiformator]